jgi:hypothetical protein
MKLNDVVHHVKKEDEKYNFEFLVFSVWIPGFIR